LAPAFVEMRERLSVSVRATGVPHSGNSALRDLLKNLSEFLKILRWRKEGSP
jgi:hypothetical protein